MINTSGKFSPAACTLISTSCSPSSGSGQSSTSSSLSARPSSLHTSAFISYLIDCLSRNSSGAKTTTAPAGAVSYCNRSSDLKQASSAHTATDTHGNNHVFDAATLAFDQGVTDH